MITKIEDIQELIITGDVDWSFYGDVYTKTSGDLVLFNYKQEAQFKGRWNFFERVCRGLILNKVTGEVVARPFDKFFNWGERGMISTAPIEKVSEKIDGSLGISYIQDGEVKIATRGSFDGEQAIWATKYINGLPRTPYSWAEEETLLFEIVYPENRVVIDYGDFSGLVLLAARNKVDGGYLDDVTLNFIAEIYRFSRPITYNFHAEEDVLRELVDLPDNKEGFVVTFTDGQMFKFKGDRYIELHKLRFGLSFKNVLDAVSNGSIDGFLRDLPEEFTSQVREWESEIYKRRDSVMREVARAFAALTFTSRKDFAIQVNRDFPHLSGYLFAHLDGKDIVPMIYAKEFNNRSSE